MVDITSFVDVDPEEVGVTELVYYPALEKILEEYDPENVVDSAFKFNGWQF